MKQTQRKCIALLLCALLILSAFAGQTLAKYVQSITVTDIMSLTIIPSEKTEESEGSDGTASDVSEPADPEAVPDETPQEPSDQNEQTSSGVEQEPAPADTETEDDTVPQDENSAEESDASVDGSSEWSLPGA